MVGHTRLFALAISLAVLATGCPPAGTNPVKAPAEINQEFTRPDLDVEVWVERFEGESREVFAARQEVLRASGVKPGARVADIGAGTGLYTRMFAEATGPDGWVYAVDIAPAFLDHINRWAHENSVGNVTAVLSRMDSVTLAPNSIDLAFVCDTYHHFEAAEPMLASIHRALVAGGTLVVIDFEKVPGTSREWVLEHVRAGKDVFRAEIERAGFTFVAEPKIAGFAENYLLAFRKGSQKLETGEPRGE